MDIVFIACGLAPFAVLALIAWRYGGPTNRNEDQS